MRKIVVGLCAVGVLMAVGVTGQAQAGARPPAGVWQGRYADGSGTFTLVLRPDGGWGVDTQGGLAPSWTTGDSWYWSSSSVGGILTLNYTTLGRFDNHLYYGITYRGGDELVLSDPYFHVVLYRLP